MVKAKSKRLRPVLVITSSLVFNNTPSDQSITAAAAIELLHLGSLVHDDIIDNADSRWGKPAVHITHGTAQAILAGDYLLAKAGELAAAISADAAGLISKTIASLVQGESRELSDNYHLNRTMSAYLQSIELKTAALISAACRLGAVSAGAKPAQADALAEYGRNLGMAFQIIDDLLDLLSTSKLMGKPAGSDIAQGIYTMPVLFGLKSPRPGRLNENFTNISRSEVIDNLFISGSFQITIEQIKQHNRVAAVELLQAGNTKHLRAMANLPDVYFNWVLDNMVMASYQKATRQILANIR